MAAPPSHSQSLLPNPGILILDRIERDADRFRLMVHVEQEPACPLCGQVSRSGHSSYRRYLQDFPWQGVSVQLWGDGRSVSLLQRFLYAQDLLRATAPGSTRLWSPN